MTRFVALCFAIATQFFLITSAQTQTVADLRAHVNREPVTIMTKGIKFPSATYMALTSDITTVLDENEEIRVLPLMGFGAVRNIEDLLYLKGIDTAIMHSDVLAHLRIINRLPGAESSIKYLARLYDEPFHVIARRPFTDIRQLNDLAVAVGEAGSDDAMSTETLIALLGIRPQLFYGSSKNNLEKLRSGEVDAMIYPSRAPSDFVRDLPSGEFYLVPIRPDGRSPDAYEARILTSEDYPNLIAPGTSVDTLQFVAVLATYNWQPGTNRYDRVIKFITALFDAREMLKEPGRHPVWQTFDPMADVPGWTRFAPAEELVSKLAVEIANERLKSATQQSIIVHQLNPRTAAEMALFVKFLRQRGELARLSDTEVAMRFNNFLQWRETQEGGR